jgi:sorbose reductase
MTIEECAAVRQPRPVPDTPSNVIQQLSMKAKVTAVTGASSGIGLAAVEAIAEAGGDVALIYNTNDDAIKHAERIVKEHGVRAKAYQCEVSVSQQVQDVLRAIVRDFGSIDVLVANAGMAISKPILEQTEEEYRRQMDVNVGGVFLCAKYVGEIFKRQGRGNLIITSSMSAHIVNVPVDQPIYNATKAAVTHMGKSLAREWREFARVNVVSPGFFDTKWVSSYSPDRVH